MARSFSSIMLTLKVTHQCNLSCRYCYYEDAMKRMPGSMAGDIVQSILKRVAESPFKRVLFSLHGGEPLLEQEFITKFFGMQRRALPGKNVVTALQTNGTLLTQDFLDSIIMERKRGHDIGIGVSLDGPITVHDTYRTFRTGQGSFEVVMNGLRLLEHSNMPFSVLAVVTSAMAQHHPRVIYEYFSSIGGLRFLDFVHPVSVKTNGGPLVYRQELAKTYIGLFDLWVEDDRCKFVIKVLDTLVRRLVGAPTGLCVFMPNCFVQGSELCIDPGGNVSPCDAFPDVILGNIKDFSLTELFSRKTRCDCCFFEERRRDACRECNWFEICHAGCPCHAVNACDPNFFCSDYKLVFAHIFQWLTEAQIIVRGALSSKNIKHIPNPMLRLSLANHILKRQNSRLFAGC